MMNMATKYDFTKSTNDGFNYYGTKPETGIQPREVKKAPTYRAEKARQIYFETKSSASVEFPYWYTRRWEEMEGEIPVIRRAEALKAGFEHLTPAILPGELLAMRKANFLRGSYPMPWLSEAFFMAKEDELYKDHHGQRWWQRYKKCWQCNFHCRQIWSAERRDAHFNKNCKKMV
jgi:hypothetical protein